MNLNYFVTEQDYVNFNFYHLNNSPSCKRMLMALKILFPVLLIIMSLNMGFKIDGFSRAFALIPAVIISILWIVFFDNMFEKTIGRSVKKLNSEGKTKEFIGEVNLYTTDDNINVIMSGVATSILYNRIEKIIYYKNTFYLYTGSMSVVIVPDRAFMSTEQRNDFVKLIEEKTNLTLQISK